MADPFEFLIKSLAETNGTIIGPVAAGLSPLGGTGLFSTFSIEPDASLMVIPATRTLCTSNILECSPEVEKTLGYLQEEAGWRLSERVVVCCALLRLGSLTEGADSSSDGLVKAYGRYYASLPKEFPGHPLTWLVSSDETKAYIASTNPPLNTALTSKLRTLTREFISAESIFASHLCKSPVDLKHWIHADLLYHTRVLDLGDAIDSLKSPSSTEGPQQEWAGINVMEDIDRYHLVPLLDLANHSGEANARWRPVFLGSGGLGVELIATKPIKNGEEVTISYAEARDTEELFFTHGIPPPPSSSTTIQLIRPELDTELPSEVPMVLGKLGIKGRGVIRVDSGGGADGLDSVVPKENDRLALLLIHGVLVGGDSGGTGATVEIDEEGTMLVSLLGSEARAFAMPEESAGLSELLSSNDAVANAARKNLIGLVRDDIKAINGADSEGVNALLVKMASERRGVLESIIGALDNL
jgi:hypothetical protein